MKKTNSRQRRLRWNPWVCCALMLVTVVGGVEGAGDGVELQGKRDGLQLTVRLTGLVGWNDGMAAAIGGQIGYDAVVRNVSGGVLGIPAPERCLYVVLTRPGTLSSRITAGRVHNVAELKPGDELKFSGEVTLLQTNVCRLAASFRNSETQKVKRVLVPHGEPVGNARAMVWTTVMVPVTNVWTGSISLSTVLATTGRLTDALRTQHEIAMRKALALERGAKPMADHDPGVNGILRPAHPNLTQQSEVLNAIRRIGSDANSESVAWLWRCFGKTGKNSPSHVAAMGELCRLLSLGLGSEHARRFIDVAGAVPTKEAVVTRLYAMDAAVLCCTRSRFVCTTKGNYFSTPVAPEVASRARAALQALTTDRLKEIQTRAKQLLGTDAPRKSGGVRKQVEPAAKPEDDKKKDAAISWPLLSVSGIVGKGQTGAAIINNRIVQVGDSILGAKVLSVDPVLKGVSVEYKGEVRFIEVGETGAGR